MPIKRVEYKGMTLNAGAFEVVEVDRFISTLYIEKKSGPARAGRAMLFSPPCPDALFANAELALASAIAFGQAVIDGEIPGLTINDADAS